MSGSLSEVQHTRTIVLWPWRTLVMVMTMHCFAGLTSMLVINVEMASGSFPVEVVFLLLAVQILLFTEPEVRWWFVWTIKEVERMGSTAVRYPTQWMLLKTYTLECIWQTLVLVSNTSVIHSCSVQLLPYCGAAIYNHLVDWTGGLDWWTGLVDWTRGLGFRTGLVNWC